MSRMMDYRDFYDIAEYGNENWKGSFTPREVAINAYDYLCEFKYSRRDEKPTHTIKELNCANYSKKMVRKNVLNGQSG